MSIEYEYRYPSDAFDFASVVKRAKGLGGGRLKWSLLVNHIYVLPGDAGDIIRIRECLQLHGGAKHKRAEYLLTMKTKIDNADGFPKEDECHLSDPGAVREILRVLGVPQKNTMEKLRGSIVVPGRGVLDFDWNPGLPVALEVECTSMARLASLVRDLGLKKPSADMRSRAGLEGQYEQHLGIERVGLKKRFDARGLKFDDGDRHRLRDMITDAEKRKRFDEMYSRQFALIHTKRA